MSVCKLRYTQTDRDHHENCLCLLSGRAAVGLSGRAAAGLLGRAAAGLSGRAAAGLAWALGTSWALILQERCIDDADDALQVASSIIEGATQGQIVNGDYSGTPNRFLMTYMDTSPSVSITPESLPPVVLFAGMTHCDMCCVCICYTIYIVFCVCDMLCINRVTVTCPCIQCYNGRHSCS